MEGMLMGACSVVVCHSRFAINAVPSDGRLFQTNKQSKTNKKSKTNKQSNSRFAINAVPSDGRLIQLKEQVVVGRREERNLPLEIGRVVVAKKVHLVPGVVCV